jgi:integrase
MTMFWSASEIGLYGSTVPHASRQRQIPCVAGAHSRGHDHHVGSCGRRVGAGTRDDAVSEVAARLSTNASDFALVCFLGLLGLRIFEAVGADIADLGEEHGHRVLRVVGKGGRVVLVPLPPAVARAVERAVGGRVPGPILLNRAGRRMDRHAATRRLHRLADAAGVRMRRMHPHMLRPARVVSGSGSINRAKPRPRTGLAR